MKVLNVGGGANRNLPQHYAGWEQLVLDIDPYVQADMVMDARQMTTLAATEYDAVFSSHCLEHFYRHDVPKVLAGFFHVLNPGGVAEIWVPNVLALMKTMLASSLDITDTWYRTGVGDPISFHDVLYGWNKAMEAGNEYYAHKCGFTPLSMRDALVKAGFEDITIGVDTSNILATARKPNGGDH